MSRYLLTISYVGSDFCGWQVQPNGNTVQAEICGALEKLFGKKTDVCGCSRTDSGVHAKMFCCHFDADTDIPCERLAAAVQFNTPDTVSVKDLKKVSDDFHARYSSSGKNYIYRIDNSAFGDPFELGRALWFKYPLDIAKMQKAADIIVGKHDFSAFCSAGSSVVDKVRTVSECTVTKKADTVEISVSADGFLYNMVRIIAGTLLEVGTNKREIESVSSALATGRREFAGYTAPPQGLYLNKVFYSR